MCLLRSVAYSVAYIKVHENPARLKKEKDKLTRMKDPKSRILREQAHQLRRLCGFDMQRVCDLDDVKTVQSVLPHHRLVVFVDQFGKDIVYKGPDSSLGQPRKNIYLLWHEQHFYAITNVKAAFAHSYFCEKCLVGFPVADRHQCGDSCWRCMGPEVHPENVPLKRCGECNRNFAGARCFDQHRQPQWNGSLTCNMKKFCTKCETSFNFVGKKKNWKHQCGHMICRYCKCKVVQNHLCYMTPWEPKAPKKTVRQMFIFFDIETRQDMCMKGKPASWHLHRPNLLICQ